MDRSKRHRKNIYFALLINSIIIFKNGRTKEFVRPFFYQGLFYFGENIRSAFAVVIAATSSGETFFIAASFSTIYFK